MTHEEARRILATPKFGDPDHITAIRVLEEHTEEVRLRVKLVGKRVRCWCCDGSGKIDCKVGCYHACPTCDGQSEYNPDKGLNLTAAILGELVLYQLRDLDAAA